MLSMFLDFVARFGPGALGSFFGALWSKEACLIRRVSLWFGGTVFAAFGTTQIAPYTHLDDGFVLRFILGVSCMAIFAKCFETWSNFNAGGLVRDVVRQWARLPPAITKPGALPTAPKE